MVQRRGDVRSVVLVFLASLFSTTAAAEDFFKITAPAQWQRSSIGASGAIYVNSKAAAPQSVVIRVFPLGQTSDSEARERMSRELDKIFEMRARLLSSHGLHGYVKTEASVRKHRSPKLKEYQYLRSRLVGLQGQTVQVIERRFVANHRLYQVAFVESREVPTDADKVEEILDRFEPVAKPNRIPANKEIVGHRALEAPCNEDRCITHVPRPKDLWWHEPNNPICRDVDERYRRTGSETLSLETIGRAGADCISNSITTLAKSVALVANLADIKGYRKRDPNARLAVSEGQVYKIQDPTLNVDAVALDRLKPLSREQALAEFESSLSPLIAEVKALLSNPGEAAKRLIGGVVNAVSDRVTEFRCVSLERQMAIACEAIAMGMPGLGAAKIAAGIKLTLPEVAPLTQLAKAALDKSSAIATKIDDKLRGFATNAGRDVAVMLGRDLDPEVADRLKRTIAIGDRRRFADDEFVKNIESSLRASNQAYANFVIHLDRPAANTSTPLGSSMRGAIHRNGDRLIVRVESLKLDGKDYRDRVDGLSTSFSKALYGIMKGTHKAAHAKSGVRSVEIYMPIINADLTKMVKAHGARFVESHGTGKRYREPDGADAYWGSTYRFRFPIERLNEIVGGGAP